MAELGRKTRRPNYCSQGWTTLWFYAPRSSLPTKINLKAEPKSAGQVHVNAWSLSVWHWRIACGSSFPANFPEADIRFKAGRGADAQAMSVADIKQLQDSQAHKGMIGSVFFNYHGFKWNLFVLKHSHAHSEWRVKAEAWFASPDQFFERKFRAVTDIMDFEGHLDELLPDPLPEDAVLIEDLVDLIEDTPNGIMVETTFSSDNKSFRLQVVRQFDDKGRTKLNQNRFRVWAEGKEKAQSSAEFYETYGDAVLKRKLHNYQVEEKSFTIAADMSNLGQNVGSVVFDGWLEHDEQVIGIKITTGEDGFGVTTFPDYLYGSESNFKERFGAVALGDIEEVSDTKAPVPMEVKVQPNNKKKKKKQQQVKRRKGKRNKSRWERSENEKTPPEGAEAESFGPIGLRTFFNFCGDVLQNYVDGFRIYYEGTDYFIAVTQKTNRQEFTLRVTTPEKKVYDGAPKDFNQLFPDAQILPPKDLSWEKIKAQQTVRA